MPTIKTKKEMNLAELIEWASKNEVVCKEYRCNEDKGKAVIFSLSGSIYFTDFKIYSIRDTFAVETEEPITEDTVIPQIIGILRSKYSNSKVSMMHNDKSVNEIIKGNKRSGLDYETLTLHVVNDDDTLTLIWYDGKLVD